MNYNLGCRVRFREQLLFYINQRKDKPEIFCFKQRWRNCRFNCANIHLSFGVKWILDLPPLNFRASDFWTHSHIAVVLAKAESGGNESWHVSIHIHTNTFQTVFEPKVWDGDYYLLMKTIQLKQQDGKIRIILNDKMK